MSAGDEWGVVFPEVGGSRSSTVTGAAILAAAVRGWDPYQADRIVAAGNWRTEYLDHYVAVTAAGARGGAPVLGIATDGLAAMRRMLHHRGDSGEVPLDRLDWPTTVTAKTVTVHGESSPARELSVPYHGGRLSGSALRDQLCRWRDLGVVEPGFADAVQRVIDDPSLLALPGRQVALIGAAAEMGPLEPLSEWGADVLALDVPMRAVADRIAGIARRGAGSVTVPQRDSDSAAGLDVAAAVGEAGAWIQAAADKPLVLGMYGYADGPRHVTLTAAADLIATRLLAQRPGTALAYLGTPTDAYLVPGDIVDGTRPLPGRGGRLTAATCDGLRTISRGRMGRRAYPVTHAGPGGSRWGVADMMLPMQGPNYALAKRLQRWRALTATAAGHPVSITVAPAAWTRSVTRNPTFEIAYSGAEFFGVQIFPPDTARYLMAAKLVADLAAPVPDRDGQPEALLYADAAHGGFWRQPYDPKSVLPLVAALGLGARGSRAARKILGRS
ncbi:hypothetical protein [Nocardia sp. alder85J]|uniref:hypothetical protein n=1 Tax=Nocardia sp. alder85J TaxID=2862949 RepID=UPI001CD78EBE|nr:hypothetical protein [Nocardia sp. alder85J]MCX4098976.1 hypothetical protein [Nocardia sp. alder85J]